MHHSVQRRRRVKGSKVSCLSTSTIPRNAWYVDSGASQHMTSARQLFSSLKKQDSRVQVELGDDAKYPVAGVGTIPFQLESGNSLDFDDVLFVPGLRKNLLSVSIMEDKGFAVEFKNQQVLIKPKESSPDTTQVIGVREGKLYRLQGEPIRALVHNNDNLCELWHKRMGHLHHRVLPILREIVTGLPEFSIEQHGVCRGCTLGKHAKVAFPSSKHRSKEILDLVIEDEEQEAPKVELGSPVISRAVQQPSGEEGRQ
jgi:hypothetical protein